MKHTVITLSRQYGSGGRLIGRYLADALGVPFYDKKLLTIASEKSGYSEEMLKQAESRASNSLLYTIATSLGAGTFDSTGLSIYDKFYLAQFDVVKQVAEEGSCVIVGRCADYILRDFDKVIKVFIHAPVEDRIQRAVSEYGDKEETAKADLQKHDKSRANYYSHYTAQKWGDFHNYHISLDSSIVGVDGSVQLIQDFIKLSGAEIQLP